MHELQPSDTGSFTPTGEAGSYTGPDDTAHYEPNDGEGSWLSNKVNRRERKETLDKQGLSQAEVNANSRSSGYLEELRDRQELREQIRARMQEVKQNQQELVKAKAQAYRQRLQQYLPPDLREP